MECWLVSSRSSKKHKALCRCCGSANNATTIAQSTRAESVAFLASASTTAKEADTRAVAALASAIICASSTVARTLLLRQQALYDVQSRRHDRRMQAKHGFAGEVRCGRETQAKTAAGMREGAPVYTCRHQEEAEDRKEVQGMGGRVGGLCLLAHRKGRRCLGAVKFDRRVDGATAIQ